MTAGSSWRRVRIPLMLSAALATVFFAAFKVSATGVRNTSHEPRTALVASSRITALSTWLTRVIRSRYWPRPTDLGALQQSTEVTSAPTVLHMPPSPLNTVQVEMSLATAQSLSIAIC